jgi:hypothetical protein
VEKLFTNRSPGEALCNLHPSMQTNGSPWAFSGGQKHRKHNRPFHLTQDTSLQPIPDMSMRHCFDDAVTASSNSPIETTQLKPNTAQLKPNKTCKYVQLCQTFMFIL